MSEKRFKANFDVSIYDSEKEEYISVSERGLEEIAKRMNEQQAKIEKIEKENRELNSIKKFAEKNGINIFLIEEAFRKCWKDNGKLFEENEKLRQQNRKLYKCALYGKTIGDEL